MNILLVTDAWFPQVSGVVRTFSTTAKELEGMGHQVTVLSPNHFPFTVPCPTYPDIRLALWLRPRIRPLLHDLHPDAVHIAAEGPLGLIARNVCTRDKIPFTTSYATRFPDYVYARCRMPRAYTYRALRWFHAPSRGVMVSTDTMKQELEEWGFSNVVRWTRGVDVDLFRPMDKNFLPDERPISMYCGRVAVEKNLEAFLDLDIPGTKYVVGDGPQRKDLETRYPDVRFPGMKHGEELARYYAAADVFVMPSLTETFGLVILEALACGVPVAAFPIQGPLDVLSGSDAGVMDEDLGIAVKKALAIPGERCRTFALQYSWNRVARTFLDNLAPVSWS
ncbi:MAG: glycosyltransferase family 4 protein [Desulfovibrionales bacterium]